MTRRRKAYHLVKKSPSRFVSTVLALDITDANKNTVYNNMTSCLPAYVFVDNEYHRVSGMDILAVDTIDIPKK